MSPEFGATATLFPIDDETLAYLRLTGRPAERVDLVERYAKAQGLWREPGDGPEFDALPRARPRPPSSRRSPVRAARRTGSRWPARRRQLPEPPSRRPSACPGRSIEAGGAHGRDRARVGGDRGHHLLHQHLQPDRDGRRRAPRPERRRARPARLPDRQDVARPGLAGGDRLPRAGRAHGAARRPRVRAGRLRLHDLHRQLRAARRAGREGDRGPTSSWSRRSCRATATSRAGSTRSSGPRTSPRRRWSSRSRSPGRMDMDLTTEPLGTGSDGRPVMLADIWPAPDEIRAVIGRSIDPELFRETYATVFEGDERWRAIPIPAGDRYAWDDASTYIAKPPFFDGLTAEPAPAHGHRGRPRARAARRLGHHGPHQPGRLDRRLVARRPVAPGARRRAARLQLVRGPPRPPRGDDARHVRQHPPAQPAGRGQGGAVHAPPARTASRPSSTTPRCATATRACRSSSSPAASTAPARRATGRPRAPRSSASAP